MVLHPNSCDFRRIPGIRSLVTALRAEVVEAVVDEMQLRYKPYRDVTIMILAYSFYQLNTVADITMTVQLAQVCRRSLPV